MHMSTDLLGHHAERPIVLFFTLLPSITTIRGNVLSHILICAHSNPGHVTPVLAVGEYLAKRGHTITFHTAEPFRKQAEGAGLRFVATTGKADIDYRDPIDLEGKDNPTTLDRTLCTVKRT